MINLIYASIFVVASVLWGFNANDAAQDNKPILFACYLLLVVANIFGVFYYIKL